MTRLTRTVEESEREEAPAPRAAPGLLQVFADGRLTPKVRALGAQPLVIGREGTDIELTDERVSRRHASVAWVHGQLHVVDLESRNGSYLNGVRVEREAHASAPAVLRCGRTVFLVEPDVMRFAGVSTLLREGAVVGPTLARVWHAIADAARGGDTVLLTGESGAGKELAARQFHQSGPYPNGPLIAINCATIPEGLAERLLFGTKKGAYSGAADNAGGYLQAAHGGTLFLDEIGELDASVQPKLLRALETKEVWPLGASAPTRVDVRICCATLRDLRARVASGAFRQDLFYRIGTSELRLPPLRERREEIPWLLHRELTAQPGEAPLGLSVSFLEACLLRSWPGNVRELIAEVRAAARKARAMGSADLALEHLSERAGSELAVAVPDAVSSPPLASSSSAPPPSREQIESALQREGWNVSRAARALGLHRNQLRRWISKHAPERGESDADESE